MKRYDGSHLFPAKSAPSAVALGVFDGMHRGHMELMRRTREAAARAGGQSVVFTFEPHPVRVLSPSQCPKLLTTLEQKLSVMEECGIDAVIVEPFTHEFAHIDPKEFFSEIIASRLHATSVIVGYDFTFGAHRQGTIETLESLGSAHAVETIVVPAIFSGDTLISSSVIRRMIASGEVDCARELLGRPYSIEGRVVAGRGIGRELNARTANIITGNEIVPCDGVYVTRTKVQSRETRKSGETRESSVYGKWLPSITSIGDNPTFPDSPYTIETHLIDAECDIAGEMIAIEFLCFMRGQIRFDSQDQLKQQIGKDVESARYYHAHSRSSNG